MQDELKTVRIRISPSWARYVGEKTWHESQQIQKLFDGGIEIVLRVAGLDEILQWVLSLGPEAEVVEPEELRDKIRESLRKRWQLMKAGPSPSRKKVKYKKAFRIMPDRKKQQILSREIKKLMPYPKL